MPIFQASARYYDLIYREKDYLGESAYVHGLIARERPGARDLLDLGCGTGSHFAGLLARGYRVCGIDQSEEMLARARARYTLPGAPGVEARLLRGDIRAFDLRERFDAVTSLFHVFSYLTEDADLLAALRCAHRHLAPGAVLVFDCWHAPAVLATPPERRVRQWQDERSTVVRTAEPTVDSVRRLVDVRFHIHVTDRATGEESEFEELHRVRYYHPEELRQALAQTGFLLRRELGWLSQTAPTSSDWGACYVATAGSVAP